MSTKKGTTDAVRILWRRYVGENPARKAAVEQERLQAEIERQGASPFDVPQVRTRATTQDILEAIRESRERS